MLCLKEIAYSLDFLVLLKITSNTISPIPMATVTIIRAMAML